MRMPPSAAFCCAFTPIGEFLIETPVIGRYTGDNIHILNILRLCALSSTHAQRGYACCYMCYGA